MLVARRGLGPEELPLINPTFRDAVRWVVYAEQVGEGIGELREAVKRDPPRGLAGQELTDFRADRAAMRKELEERDALLYPGEGHDG